MFYKGSLALSQISSDILREIGLRIFFRCFVKMDVQIIVCCQNYLFNFEVLVDMFIRYK